MRAAGGGAPRLVIFDADGTLRWTSVPGQRCPHRAGEWRLMPNVEVTVRGLVARGVRLALASNQNDVALGLLGRADAERLLRETLAEAAGPEAAEALIALCTCAPDGDCPCRKPRPGMLLALLEASATAPADALMVGDLDIDRQAASAAGVPFRWAGEFFGWPR